MENISRLTTIWFGFFILAFVNGALRELFIKKFVKEPWAHHLSAFTAILFFGIYQFLLWGRINIHSFSEAFWLGVYWLILTVLAETFIVGRWLGKQSYQQIFSSYNILKGNLWPLVLLWIALSPALYLFILG